MNQSKAHVFVGTSGKMTLHTLKSVRCGDIIPAGKQMVEVVEVIIKTKSRYYLNHHFYELNFKAA